MNFLFISPNFPTIYSHFVKSLKDRGVNVFGIGDNFAWQLNDELKVNLTEYCYVSDLSRVDWLKNTIDYIVNKYGPIDYIESNNEFWLMNDAILREYANVKTGMWPKDMEIIKYKSKMKEYFQKANVKVARYILVSTVEASLNFIKEVGYPVFAKPDNGVGAAATFKINNEQELYDFHNQIHSEQYIMEEFLSGYIVSFDGICDDQSRVCLCFKETFPTPIAEVVHNGGDVYYYAESRMDDAHYKRGCDVIKSFGIKKRCFHIEFFVLNEDKEGLGKCGDFIGLEVNMRCPGGNTPDLLCLTNNTSFYDVYADIIVYNQNKIPFNEDTYVAISVSRKNHFNYQHTHQEIFDKYYHHIKEYGDYSPEIAVAMGDHYYFGQFKTLEEALEFQQFVLLK